MANGQCFNQACPCNEAFSQELVLGSLGFSRCCGTDSNIRLPWQFSDFRSNSKEQDPFFFGKLQPWDTYKDLLLKGHHLGD